MKRWIFTLSAFFLAFNALANDDAGLYETFKEHTPDSPLTVAYHDVDAYLKSHVYAIGLSNREKASKSDHNIGTRFRTRINTLTGLEGNRFYFESLNEESKQGTLDSLTALSWIQEDLEALSTEVPLELLSKDEQIAYWINLYNFTLLEKLAEFYPRGSLRSILDYGDENSILAEKSLNVAGIPLSLNDIQFVILKNKTNSNPLVIYGLFQGIIGAPNIQKKAFTGENLWELLEKGAYEFINANRGVYSGYQDNTVRISHWYERNLAYFDNDIEKVRLHILKYLDKGQYSNLLETAQVIETDIEDWTFADMFGSKRKFGGGNNINAAAFMNAIVSVTNGHMAEDLSEAAIESKIGLRFSAEQLALLKDLKQTRNLNRANVTVTDLESDSN